MSDISTVFIWWFTILLLGIIFFPLTTFIFSRFIDKGYSFSKIIGILIASYVLWFFSSFEVIPFTRLAIIIILLGATIINWILLRKWFRWDKFPTGYVVIEELLFLAGLGFWSFVRGNEPSIHGLEKFMDFGFVNSLLRTTYMPPLDMWLTKSPDYTGGYFINYYYYGHYVAAFLTRLSGIDSIITYNLMIATLFAFTFILPFSLAINIVHILITQISNISSKAKEKLSTFNTKYIILGLIAAFLVSMAGNLHTLYVFTTGYPNDNPQPPWELGFGFYPDRYWYPNATRFIPFTIHEFPIYSFVVADLHGHVSDIPFVLLTLAVLLTILLPKPERRTDETDNDAGRPASWQQKISGYLDQFNYHTSISLYKLLFLGFLLAVMYMTNAWDGLIYMILSGLVFLYVNAKKWEEYRSLKILIYRTFSASLFLVFFFLVASLPFALNFRPFASGIGVLCAPETLLDKHLGPLLFEKGKCQKSPWWMLIILWGFFYFNVVTYLLFIIIPSLKDIQVKFPHLKKRYMSPLWKLFTRIENFWASLALRFLSLPVSDAFIIILVFISTLLLIFPEYFYLKDIYPAHYRANTMFKLGYQAFMMLGISSAYIIFRIRQSKTGLRMTPGYVIYRFFLIICLVLVSIYPYFSINSYYNGLKNYQGLDGLKWMASFYPDDYQAILWIRSNIDCKNTFRNACNNQPVIVEANGESYTDYARVSANTGLPTIVGWPVHEWLWRGSYDEAGKRIPEVQTIYESSDVSYTKELLKKYNVNYIFVGQLEKEKYKQLNIEKISSLGKVVYEGGNTKIYKVNSL